MSIGTRWTTAGAVMALAGLVTSRVRTGTVVHSAAGLSERATRERLASAADRYAAQSRTLGIDLDTAVAMLRARWPAGEPSA
ncbi:MAG: hypothetical protein V9G19_17960 [Tetrasphaera sp.]